MYNFYKTVIVLLCLQSILFANQIDKSVKIIEQTNKQLNSYQKKIDKNEILKEDILNEYKYIKGFLKNVKSYNEQLKKIIQSQENENMSLSQQIESIEETKKNILPLMKDMIKSLRILVEQDTPFLLKERLDRIDKLENTLSRADIQTHEKYRIILEVFKIEYDYAKTLETYQEKIEKKTYNILRLGRVALYYQSLDLKEYGYYNKQKNSWEKISDKISKSNIRKAIKIANKQENVDFLNLPFLAMKESK